MEKLVNKENPDLGVWPSMAEMRRDLKKYCESNRRFGSFKVEYVTVQAWLRNKRVPWWWIEIVEGAALFVKGVQLTKDELNVICPDRVGSAKIFKTSDIAGDGFTMKGAPPF